MIEHDFKMFPELTNSQLNEFGLTSPHEQITEDFEAVVTKVHDGDTVTLATDFRDFEFPLRIIEIDAPELNTGADGQESRDWLKNQIWGERVQIKINKDNRVDKYGRLLGSIIASGINIAELSIVLGYSLPFGQRRQSDIPDINKTFDMDKWFP